MMGIVSRRDDSQDIRQSKQTNTLPGVLMKDGYVSSDCNGNKRRLRLPSK